MTTTKPLGRVVCFGCSRILGQSKDEHTSHGVCRYCARTFINQSYPYNKGDALRLKELRQKYGEDFEEKLPMYKTARLDTAFVKLVSVYVPDMTARVCPENGVSFQCSILDLEDFVL